jgi:4-carboxymuconolactone decarboxylase
MPQQDLALDRTLRAFGSMSEERPAVPRLSAVERESLPEDQRRFFDAVKWIRRHPISGPFIVTMNSSPDLAARIAHLGHYFHARGQGDESILPMRVRGFVSVIGSRALDAPYEWSAWVNWALDAGVPQQTVDDVREGRPPRGLTADDMLISDLCTQLISGNHRLSDATFRAALDRFGPQGLLELVVTVGYFALIALPLNAFEIEMAAEQLRIRKPFAPLPVGGSPWSGDGSAERVVPAITGTRATPRIRLLAGHDDVAPEHQHFVDRVVLTRGWLSGLFQVLLHSPDVAARIANIGDFVLYHSVLPPAVRWLACLIAARELDCDYAWDANVRRARAAGVDDALIGALERGGPAASQAGEHRVIFDFCLQLLRGNHHVAEDTYQATVRKLGIAATVQLAVTVGYIVMTSLVANAFDIPPAGDDTKPAL